MEFEAKNFQTRVDLENEVRNKLGLTPNHKPEHLVVGSQHELARLFLSEKSIFWGINCKVVEPEKPKKVKKPKKSKKK